MEADWEVELGPESPVIDVAWTGFVDLQTNPDRMDEIAETARLPRLAAALSKLNAQTSFPNDPYAMALQTVKCDLWPTGACDPYEMEATPATSVYGIACYIDLVPRQEGVFPSLQAAESWAKLLSQKLRIATSPASRVDLIVRRAVTPADSGFGITAYISACGASVQASEQALGGALDVFAENVTAPRIPSRISSTLQP